MKPGDVVRTKSNIPDCLMTVEKIDKDTKKVTAVWMVKIEPTLHWRHMADIFDKNELELANEKEW